MLLRAIAIPHDRVQPDPIRGSDGNGYSLAHRARLAQSRAVGNNLWESSVRCYPLESCECDLWRRRIPRADPAPKQNFRFTLVGKSYDDNGDFRAANHEFTNFSRTTQPATLVSPAQSHNL